MIFSKNGSLQALFHLWWQFKEVESKRFSAKMASLYSLTFWPKLCVLRYFFICNGSSKKLKVSDFRQKWQAYSLTFWPKLTIFGHFFSRGASSRKLKVSDFRQKWQAYSLTFLPKLGVLR